ncbi:MAG: phosphatidate cytidylyltransferase [Alphaproteobacteria bacterium]
MAQGFDLSSLQIRLLSAAVLIPVVLVVLYTGGWPFITLLAGLAFLSLYEWGRMSFACDAPERYYFAGAGVLYIPASFVACYFVFQSFGFYWAMACLFMIWGSDTGAYVFGKTFGGPKLAEKISPNKTWSGFAGALLIPAVNGFVAVFIYSGVDGFQLGYALTIAAIGVALGLAGQAGDLLVSALKRRAGLKDTGDIIPGHGGVLDRIDSMLLAAPVFLILMSLV